MTSLPQGGPLLKCLSLNVNGLARRGKREALFRLLISGGWHVVLLQETHHATPELAGAWARHGAGPGQPWPGCAFFSSFHSSRTRGVAVLVRDGGPVVVDADGSGVHMDDEGRILRVDGVYNGEVPVSFLSVYAPCVAAERPDFFSSALPCLVPAQGLCFVGGDFNCVGHRLDQVGDFLAGREKGFREWEALEVSEGWEDAYRVLHPQGRDATFVATNRRSGARLDRWYVPGVCRDWIRTCGSRTGFLGDHDAVVLEVAPPVQVAIGPGAWCFPPHLHGDAPFLTDLARIIEHWLGSHSAVTGGHRQRWLALKEHVKDVVGEYAIRSRNMQRYKDRELERAAIQAKAAFLLHPLAPGLGVAWAAARQKLSQSLVQARSDAVVAEEALWHTHGERPTAFFHRVGRALPRRDVIREIKDQRPGGQSVVLSEDLATCVAAGDLLADYFDGGVAGGLFVGGVGDIAAQQVLLQAVDCTLSQVDASLCEGPQGDGSLSLAELSSALKAAAKGKRPGADGLPYEFYSRFWSLLGPVMLACFNEALGAQGEIAPLAPSLNLGLITLIHKGGGKPKDDPAAYRPITLLNCDYKLVAKALACRFDAPLASVIDVTQSAFVKHRWIGDNVLFHLEEIDYVQDVGGEGCILFLDFEKAYDRLDRGWLELCMQRLGFVEGARRWVRILHGGARGRVLFNGWRSRPFAINSGVAQGSPLSPLLYVLAAQPLSALLRLWQSQGKFQSISLPHGVLAPPCHQHADDTTLHTRTTLDAKIALEVVDFFCKASRAKLNITKSQGLALGTLAPGLNEHGVELNTLIPFVPPGEHVRHLGVMLGLDRELAARATFQAKLKSMALMAKQWGRCMLSYYGRLHVAKQCMVSMVGYAASFIPPPPDLLKSIEGLVHSFIHRSSGLGDGPDPPSCRPAAMVAALPRGFGGVGMVDLGAHVCGLQAKVVAALLHPARRPWKPLMRHMLHRCRVGASLAFAFPAVSLQPGRPLSHRHVSYLRSMRRCEPRRLIPPLTLPFHAVMREPLLHNCQITRQSKSLRVSDVGADRAAWRVGDLRRAHLGNPGDPALTGLLALLPTPWRAFASLAVEPQAEWYSSSVSSWVCQGLPQLTSVFFLAGESGLLSLQANPPPPLLLAAEWRPCCVADLPRKGPAPLLPAGSPHPRLLIGPWESVDVDPSAWGFGGSDLLRFRVQKATLQVLHVAQFRHDPSYSPAEGVRPKLWPDPRARLALDGSPLSGLLHMEKRWKLRYDQRAGFQPVPRPSRVVPAQGPQGVPGPRPSVAERQQMRLDLSQSQSLPVLRTVSDVHPLWDTGAPPSPWKTAWGRLRDPGLPRRLQDLGWRILHGGPFCNASRLLQPSAMADTACCSAVGCAGVPETLVHMFLQCPCVRPAVDWFLDLWLALEGRRPPLDAMVLLGDDHRLWRPAPSLSAMWTCLRLSLLAVVWGARCRRHVKQVPFTASGVASAVVGRVNALIRMDWLRVVSDPSEVLRVSPVLVRGLATRLSQVAFERRWCHRGMLCRLLTSPTGPRLEYRFSVSFPVPCPPPSPSMPSVVSLPPEASGEAYFGWDEGLLEDLGTTC